MLLHADRGSLFLVEGERSNNDKIENNNTLKQEPNHRISNSFTTDNCTRISLRSSTSNAKTLEIKDKLILDQLTTTHQENNIENEPENKRLENNNINRQGIEGDNIFYSDNEVSDLRYTNNVNSERHSSIPQTRCLVSKLFDVCSKSTLIEMEKKEEIRIPWGMGIVGYVAESGVPVNIPDAYKVSIHILFNR